MKNRILKEDNENVVQVKTIKGGDDGDADELDLQVKVERCEKGSEACKKLEEEGKEVTERQFAKDLAGNMMAALEEKDGDGDDRRLYSYCWYEYWCGVYYCYKTLYCI